ncbi:hypothetical protein ACQCX2_01520 [Propionibacteriaceae bacterium Y1700]|uniref:hypothetical protein n=1 Tax=Microlunatus sp. Y1700 TaxID=3418487 RepID=UPI003DA79C9F
MAHGMRSGRNLVEKLIREAITAGQLPSDRDPVIETDLVLALTGLAPLLELGVLAPQAALDAIDLHLDRLFGQEN